MKVLEKIIELKIVSIIVFIIFGIFSYYFLKDSPPVLSTRGIWGIVFAATCVISGIYILLHYLISENYKKIIDLQYTAMDNISKTHTAIESVNQETLINKQQRMIGGDKYIATSSEKEDSTNIESK